MFGTTYLCEKTFSRIQYVKYRYRTNMSDENLRALLNAWDLKPKARLFHNFVIKKPISPLTLRKLKRLINNCDFVMILLLVKI